MQAQVKSYYEQAPSPGHSFSLVPFLTTAGTYGETTINGETISSPFNPTQLLFGLTVIPNNPNGSATIPNAYLRLVEYNAENQKIHEEVRHITTYSLNSWENLLEISYIAQGNGRVEIFVANESDKSVWFDELSITHEQHLIAQETHYDPWGLELAGIGKAGLNRFTFNAQSEKQKDLNGGKGYFYETDFRGYDPQLGRFHGYDLLASAFSGITPYQFGFNNPVRFNDPTGLAPSDTTKSGGSGSKADDGSGSGDSGGSSVNPTPSPEPPQPSPEPSNDFDSPELLTNKTLSDFSRDLNTLFKNKSSKSDNEIMGIIRGNALDEAFERSTHALVRHQVQTPSPSGTKKQRFVDAVSDYKLVGTDGKIKASRLSFVFYEVKQGITGIRSGDNHTEFQFRDMVDNLANNNTPLNNKWGIIVIVGPVDLYIDPNLVAYATGRRVAVYHLIPTYTVMNNRLFVNFGRGVLRSKNPQATPGLTVLDDIKVAPIEVDWYNAILKAEKSGYIEIK